MQEKKKDVSSYHWENKKIQAHEYNSSSRLLCDSPETNSARGIDIGMEERRDEFTFGGFEGYSSLNSSVTLYTPPDQSVPSFPGTPVSQCMMFDDPSPRETGRAWKPKGWSRRHALRSFEYCYECRLKMASPRN